MQIACGPQRVVALAPAKLNLFLEVLAKRADGYHELEMLVVSVSLYDTLVFKEDATGEVSLRCDARIGAAPELTLPSGRDNLVVQAAQALRQEAGVRRGVSIQLTKRIPPAAGLGGGSSDAAATLAALNRLWGLGLSTDELSKIGAKLGSDVPFFFHTPSAVCRGRGEEVSPVRLPLSMHFVIACPPVGLKTAEVYGQLRFGERQRAEADGAGSMTEGADSAASATGAPSSRVYRLVQALERGDLSQAGRLLSNRLSGPAEELSAEVGRLRERLAGLGLAGQLMTGSGSACFGVCRSARQARRVAGMLRGGGISQVFVVRSAE